MECELSATAWICKVVLDRTGAMLSKDLQHYG
jgi:hypothetical protein